MSSEKQIEANRRNAQLSTGPKTPEGKAKVARNPCTHGLCARETVLNEEDPDEFQALLDGFRDEFQPATAREEALVRQAADAEWRLRRITRLETGVFAAAMGQEREWEEIPDTASTPACTRAEQRHDENTFLLGKAFQHNCGGEVFVKLMRYGNSIRRAFYKALAELKAPPPSRRTKMTEQTQFPSPDFPQPPPLPLPTLAEARSEPSRCVQPCSEDRGRLSGARHAEIGSPAGTLARNYAINLSGALRFGHARRFDGNRANSPAGASIRQPFAGRATPKGLGKFR